jgi:hypothetical protein
MAILQTTACKGDDESWLKEREEKEEVESITRTERKRY